MKLKDLLHVAGLAKSVYYYWVKHMDTQDHKNRTIVETIKTIVSEHRGRFGYRRVTLALKEMGIKINHKRVLRLMREHNLLCAKFNRKSRKFITYRGKVGRLARNRFNRRFKTDRPYQKLVTDITQFKIQGTEQRLYLSPIMDLYNNEIISYKISDRPTYDIVHEPLCEALARRPELDYRMTIHSDQGWHYQMKQWCAKLKAHKVFQSMSRKGNCLDNSPMENFFGLLKQEMFYGEAFDSYDTLKTHIETYIRYYNHDRVKVKLDGLSPVKYREANHLENPA